MEIKVCGLKIPSNVESILQLGIHYVGFIFYEDSPRNMDLPPEAFTGFDKLHSKTVKKVGVFVNAKIEFILEKVKAYQLDYVQLHGDENVFYCSKLKGKGIKIIKAFSVDEDFIFTQTEAFQYYCDYFLFDTKGKNRGGNGVVFEWRILERYKGKTPFFLSGGIKPELAGKIKKLDYPMLAALDLNSGFEIEPGYKNVQVISDFINDLNTERVGDWGGSR